MTKSEVTAKPVDSHSLPDGYSFKNEHGNVVTVIYQFEEWCMVNEEGKRRPFLLRKSFILAIKNEGSDG